MNFKTITEVLESLVIIQVNHTKESFKKDKLEKLLRNIKPLPVYPDGLFTIDLRHYFRGKNIKKLIIELNTRSLNSSTLLIGKVSVRFLIQNPLLLTLTFHSDRTETLSSRRRRGGWDEARPVQPGEAQRGQAGGPPGRVGLHLQHQVQPGDL